MGSVLLELHTIGILAVLHMLVVLMIVMLIWLLIHRVILENWTMLCYVMVEMVSGTVLFQEQCPIFSITLILLAIIQTVPYQ